MIGRCSFLHQKLSQLLKKHLSTVVAGTSKTVQGDDAVTTPIVPDYIELHQEWPEHDRNHFLTDMLVMEDFLSVDEELQLFKEVDPYMQRLRYEFDHWDDAIHGFRETERQKWYPHNRLVIERVNETAFADTIMPYIHVLDLADEGVIKPHVDSARYCGSTIAGLSLMSDCVMRLVRTDEKKYVQSTDSSDDHHRDRTVPTNVNSDALGQYYADIWLKRRSLYIMRDTARYNYTHEILANASSAFKGQPVVKGRRISVICRNKP